MNTNFEYAETLPRIDIEPPTVMYIRILSNCNNIARNYFLYIHSFIYETKNNITFFTFKEEGKISYIVITILQEIL